MQDVCQVYSFETLGTRELMKSSDVAWWCGLIAAVCAAIKLYIDSTD